MGQLNANDVKLSYLKVSQLLHNGPNDKLCDPSTSTNFPINIGTAHVLNNEPNDDECNASKVDPSINSVQ